MPQAPYSDNVSTSTAEALRRLDAENKALRERLGASPAVPTDAQVALLDPWMRPAAARELLTQVLAIGAPAVDAQGERDAAFEAVRNRLRGLQRYSFVLDDDGAVRRVQDRTGSWIEFDDAHALFDPAAVDAALAAHAAAKTGDAA